MGGKFPIFDKIKRELPSDAEIEDFLFEGANIVLYTKNRDFFLNGKSVIKDIVNKIKKRIELRAAKSIIKPKEKTEEIIKEIVPEKAGLDNLWFDSGRSRLIIEAKRPGLVIGKGGSTIGKIKKKTNWVPQVRRSPAIESKLIKTVRHTLYQSSDYRRKFLNEVGEEIYRKYERPEDFWIRTSFLGGQREVGRSSILLQTPDSNVLLDCGVNVAAEGKGRYPLLDVPEFDIDELDAAIVSHAHLDHHGFVPWLYKMGFEGPVYSTRPTRDIMTLLQIDYIDIAQREGNEVIFSSKDVKKEIKHSICLDYGEVTDITPDVRLTFKNAGHILGSSLVHLNIGNGFNNVLYTGDLKYYPTRLLAPSKTDFQRLETLMIESTYGGREDMQPSRKKSEKKLVDITRKTLKRGGKVLIPALAIGRAQEVMLILEEAIRNGNLPDRPIYIDGMIWDISAIHTAYPGFMNNEVKRKVLGEEDPFLADCFNRVGSHQERMDVIEEEGPCIIIATSGMMVGGPSVTYFERLAENEDNSIIFVSYQAEGSLGRSVERGKEKFPMVIDGKRVTVEREMGVHSIEGFSGHSDRQQLMNFVKRLDPSPRRGIVVHGEKSKSLSLASAIHRTLNIETSVPRELDALRIR